MVATGRLAYGATIMQKSDPLSDIDWSLTTWEGSRREQLRRWKTSFQRWRKWMT
jgi:hypothetical protein